MNTKQFTFLSALIFYFLFGNLHVVFADNQQVTEQLRIALDAAKKGDIKTAYNIWLSLGKQGNARAQANLGLVYAKGDGVAQDYKKSLKWYRLAADQGWADAQYNVGLGYANGQGVPQDYKEALKWTKLAAEQSHARAQKNVAIIEKKLAIE